MLPTFLIVLVAAISIAAVMVYLFRGLIRHVRPVLVVCADTEDGPTAPTQR